MFVSNESLNMNNNRTLILGLGNILLNDEGIGVHAAKAMSTLSWPAGVDVLDGGTGGFTLLSVFHTYQNLIIIDACLSEDSLGTLKILEPKFAGDFPKALSTHELGMKDMIESAILLEKLPKIFLITVSINNNQKMNMKLSPDMKRKIPEIIKSVKNLLKNKLNY